MRLWEKWRRQAIAERINFPEFREPPSRVVSLVPSITESLFDLGFGEAVVGITDYCIYPQEAYLNLPHVGGTKNPRLGDVLGLQPDLVIVNQEENSQEIVEALQAEGVPVWVTFPTTVRQSIDLLWALMDLFHDHEAALRVEIIEAVFEWSHSAASHQKPVKYFCPIWQSDAKEEQFWWMTFNRHTYSHDLLGLVGGENIFSDRERRYPLAADLGAELPHEMQGRDTRYPRVRPEEVIAAEPSVILLPDEPYPFTESHLDSLSSLLSETPAVWNGCVHLVDGSLITWPGTRLARALQELPQYFVQPLVSSADEASAE